MTLPKPLLKVAAEQWMPWASLSKENDSIYVGGPMGDILRVLSRQMNFEYEVLQPPDGHWGILRDNGSWTGMVGMALNDEVEFAMGPFIMSYQRFTAVDFTTPVHSDGISILTSRPTIKNDIEGILKPFTSEVWALIMFSLLIISVAVAMINTLEEHIFNLHTRNIVSKSTMWSVKTIAQESSEWLPEKDAGRLVVTTWLLASLVFMSSYSGILTAMLTAPRVTIPVDSLEDLVSQNDIPWKLLTGSFLLNYFKESQYEVHRKAYYESSGTIPDCWQGKEAMVRGEYTAICGETTSKKAISWDFSTHGRCHLYMARSLVYTNSLYGLVFKSDSLYLEKANAVIDTLKESGLITFWLNQQLTNVSQCMRPPTADRSTDAVTAINIEAFGGSFITLAAGYTLGFLMLLGEKVVFSFKPKD